LTDDATMIGPAVGRRNCSQSATLLLSEPLDEYVGPENPVRLVETLVDVLDVADAGLTRVKPKMIGCGAVRPSA
jgi:hypothetical protein